PPPPPLYESHRRGREVPTRCPAKSERRCVPQRPHLPPPQLLLRRPQPRRLEPLPRDRVLSRASSAENRGLRAALLPPRPSAGQRTGRPPRTSRRTSC